MVLPPTVVGFFLLLLLGKNSYAGKFFALFDYNFIFSWEATVVSAVVVSFPLMYRTARGAFEQLDNNIIYAARILGISEWKIFWRVMLPNSFYGIMAGVVLAHKSIRRIWCNNNGSRQYSRKDTNYFDGNIYSGTGRRL